MMATSRPLVGITGKDALSDTNDHESPRVCGVRRDYLEYISRNGADIVILPHSQMNDPCAILERLDGIIFSGGEDIDPIIYGEAKDASVVSVCRRRDDFELELMRIAHQLRLPIYAICRGCQVLNVFRKGTLVQHLDGHRLGSGGTPAERCHSVSVTPETLLFSIVKQRELSVTSSHHQAVKALGTGLRISAVAADGVVEAIEDIDPLRFILGVQGHPEREVDAVSDAIAQAFIAAASERLK